MTLLEKSLVVVISVLIGACSSHVYSENQTRPAHHTDDGFRNLHIGPISKGPFGFVKMRYFSDEPFADHTQEAHEMDIAEPNYAQIKTPVEAPQITWLGHSTFLIQYNGVAILTDPILSDRASPVSFAGPERLVPKPVRLEHLPDIDYIVISHNHYDHLDLETLGQLAGDIPILTPLKLGDWMVSQGFEARRFHQLDWWQGYENDSVNLTALPCQHWSARGLFDRNETLWATWLIDIAGFKVWFGGDTGYNPYDFRDIGNAYDDIDLGLIPIGAYGPRWFMSQQHVDPAEAIQIHKDIGAKKSIGMHWGTFQLSAEPMMEPKEWIEQEVQKGTLGNGAFVTLAIGETMVWDQEK